MHIEWNEIVIDTIAWIGSVCFMLCAVPQVIECMETGTARGLSSWFLLLWGCGEICYIIAIVYNFGCVQWMLGNYVVNIVCISALVWFKVKDSIND